MPRTSTKARKLEALRNLLTDRTSMLIVLQDNPDPDALAAAAALRELSNRLAQVRCTITCGGTVGRAENRALLHYLDLNLRPIDQVDVARFDLIAMVDTQPGTGNNALAPGIIPAVVIDHHPLRPDTRRAGFRDIRPRYGATSTILFEYLTQAGLAPDTRLATAIAYGIRSDTQDFGRESTRDDINAYEAVHRLANKRMLGLIQRGRATTSYFRTVAAALAHAHICGDCIFSDLGVLEHPDTIAEAADLLLRHEETQWSLCWGYHGERALLSIRTLRTDQRADRTVRRIVGRKGTGGGHRSMAGGQIPLATPTEKQRNRLSRLVSRRFIRATGNEGKPCRKLVPPE